MEQYIKKSALVAEIENLLKPIKQRLERDKNDPWDSDIAVYKFGIQLIKNIDTLEVKEVDEEPISIWHDASEKSNEPENVVIINPSDNTGEVLTKCINVYQGRIWAYTSVLLKLDNSFKIGKNLQEEPKIPQVFDEGYWERLGEEPVSKEIGDYDHKAVMESLHPKLKEESVSEDLEKHISLVTERMLKEGPIPTLKGKEKTDFENEFNRFKQITGMINWPSREEIYKNVILWFIAWSKEHLKIGDIVDKSEIDKQLASDDLEKAANEWDAKASFTPFYMALDGNGNPYEIKQDYTTHAESFKAGAKWQKEKEYTCYEEAFEDGATWKRNQMMAKAIDAHCFGFQGAALFSFRLPADNYLIGSEVKIIVIKED